ncbi:pyridoxamine 5'-phosphate oxidase family protein [Streptomyces litchfieldiae]|uniref:Pyridoxamine 5'-phosphate oxidase n=1 Tax=Streptomyces litchfieldiae TaxID=3075543 RepID=A0ABU2MUK3_9ACTN|nr:pyridoxamine 5'-phosphate oxidase family protein [Streptomyces sp. DSM 44938]MDT0345304.1 pyridoxamine 5'-phosphate oxidase [Streptomyces sp. DSM 44938]
MVSEVTPPREAAQRKRDVLRRLREDVDAWVSTASPDGVPCLVPLAFLWHEGTLVMTTRATNPTAVNARKTGRATLSLGHTRDVVLIETEVDVIANEAVTAAEGDAFAAKHQWDTRGRPEWAFLRFRPVTIRAWREENELAGRHLMKDGVWLV